MSDEPKQDEIKDEWVKMYIEYISKIHNISWEKAKLQVEKNKEKILDIKSSNRLELMADLPELEARLRVAINQAAKLGKLVSISDSDDIKKQLDVIENNPEIVGIHYHIYSKYDCEPQPSLSLITRKLYFKPVLDNSSYYPGNERGYTYTGRKDIGRFAITLNKHNGYVPRALNLSRWAESEYGHWGISHSQCCWGGWGDAVNDCIKQQNLTGLMDITLSYIQSAGAIGAYMEVDRFLDNAYDIAAADELPEKGYPDKDLLKKISQEKEDMEF